MIGTQYEPGNSTEVELNHRSRKVRALRSLKGGDPSAGSPTDTLLRLHSSQ